MNYHETEIATMETNGSPCRRRTGRDRTARPADTGVRPGLRLTARAALTAVAGALCITLLQYSQCTYQTMSSPPWSVDPFDARAA